MTAVNSAQSIIPYFLGGLVGLGPSLLVGWSLAGYVRHWLAEKPLTHNTEMRSDFTSEARTKKQVSSHGRYLDERDWTLPRAYLQLNRKTNPR